MGGSCLAPEFPITDLSDLRIVVNVPSADEPHQQSSGGISLENPGKEQLPATIDIRNRGTEGGMYIFGSAIVLQLMFLAEGAGMFQGSRGHVINGGYFTQINLAQGAGRYIHLYGCPRQ